MNCADEAAIEVSFLKAFLLSAVSMLCFVAGLFVIGIPMQDPLLIGFLIVMVAGMTFVFAICIRFMLRTKISREGLRPAAPTFYQTVLRWDEVTCVRRANCVGYVVKGHGIGEFCILPRPFLLKKPESLRELIEQYAPIDNIVRKELAR